MDERHCLRWLTPLCVAVWNSPENEAKRRWRTKMSEVRKAKDKWFWFVGRSFVSPGTLSDLDYDGKQYKAEFAAAASKVGGWRFWWWWWWWKQCVYVRWIKGKWRRESKKKKPMKMEKRMGGAADSQEGRRDEKEVYILRARLVRLRAGNTM